MSIGSIIFPGAKSVVLAQTVIVRSEALLIKKAEINEATINAIPSKYRGVKTKRSSRIVLLNPFMCD
jgi:hypothetical protein